MERLRAILNEDDELRRGLRLLAGLLLATGMLLVAFRRASFADPWGDLPILLVFLAPCAFLYGTGMLAARRETLTRGWEGVYVVFGILLIPVCGFQFVELVDENTDAPLNSAWIFALTAAAGVAAALLARVRYGFLLASLALIVAWLALWDEILADGIGADVGTLRGLLVLVALLLLAGGLALYRPDRERTAVAGSDRGVLLARLKERAAGVGFGEVVTGAGVAGVAAGAISVAAITGRIPFAEPPAAEASLLWDLELLVASLALIAFGAWAVARGPAYVGAAGLLLFVLVVGLDLDDDSPEGKLLGWPLILLVLGALALAASVLPSLRERLPRRSAGPPG